MKRRFQKIAALMLVGAMAGTLVTGCGGSSSGSSSESSSDSKEASDSSSSNSNGAAEVTLWHYFEHEAPDLEAVAEKYNESQDKIHVTCTYVSREELMNQYTIGAVSGELPDIGMVDSPDMESYISLGVFEDITDDIKDWDELDQFYDGPLSSCMDADGKYYGLPNNSNCLTLCCNMDILNAAGIENPPTTWEELDAACAKLKEAGITPITADDAYLTSFIGYHFARYIGQDGVKSLVTGEEYNGESVTWDDEKVKAAAESFADFAKKGYFSKNIATNKYPAGQNQEFAPGDAAIVICGSWLPNEAKDSVAEDLEWGYFNYPSVPDGKDDNTANNIANQVLAINKDSKMADKAFQLIEYITTGEYDKKMTEDALCIPTDKANSDAWPTELAGVKEAFDATTTFYDWAAGVESNNDITPVLQENTQKLASGKLDAAGFIKAMKEAAGQ